MSNYFPLKVIDQLNENDVLNTLLDTFKESVSQDIGKEIILDEDFPKFVLSDKFFEPEYDGKYKDANDYLLYNKKINQLVLNGIHFNDWHQRQTEWRDMFGEYYVLKEWCKSKIVYKIDNEFFHEVKNTGNLKISKAMFKYLPVHTMYFDLYDVENIGDFKGAWVNINSENDEEYLLFTVYMVTEGNLVEKNVPAFFSYYCGFWFRSEEETELDLKEALSDVVETFHINDYRTFNTQTGEIIRHPLNKVDDHRAEIVTAILQILQFLHAKIEDISESPITMKTYKPSQTIKNKFSEVRMWDVGVRYGKAIKFAKQEMEKEIKLYTNESAKEKKTRKPVRPHIRSAHWQRYHVGEGRKQIKVNWIPPVYVCGGKEIAVTIHKVS